MAKEIERKFLVLELPENFLPEEKLSIEQGYAALDPAGMEVRLRKTTENYWLTIKSGGDLQRSEYEVSLSAEQFETLWPSTEGRRLRKDRYLIKREGHTIEIDQYHQPLTGLVVAEIEFPDEASAMAYTPEPWMAKDITHLSFLKNKHLLQFESLQALMEKL